MLDEFFKYFDYPHAQFWIYDFFLFHLVSHELLFFILIFVCASFAVRWTLMSEIKNWIELNWIELNWIELNWIELNWIELNWIELNWIWIELNWIELNWIELNWIELNWIELNWIELNWIELNWIELNWIELNIEQRLNYNSLHTDITLYLPRIYCADIYWTAY